MKKTSVYLDEHDKARLERLADDLGLSQAEIIRLALFEYEQKCAGPRTYSLAGAGKRTGKPVSQMTPEELDALMAGFGED